MAEKMDVRTAPDDVFPLCPHCKKELKYIWQKTKGLGFLEQKAFLMCPHCRAFLGYSVVNSM